jgi:hypothetical protein
VRLVQPDVDRRNRNFDIPAIERFDQPQEIPRCFLACKVEGVYDFAGGPSDIHVDLSRQDLARSRSPVYYLIAYSFELRDGLGDGFFAFDVHLISKNIMTTKKQSRPKVKPSLRGAGLFDFQLRDLEVSKDHGGLHAAS